MKYYESTFEDYLQSKKRFNLHPELENIIEDLPQSLEELPNLVLYGPSGVGKYTQALSIIEKYSLSKLHYDKKVTITNEKNEKKKELKEKKNNSKKNDFLYRISDIHYEIDMGLLGCNSKTLWNDIFSHIIDIISAKQKKEGIILCKNMHNIYHELLDVFDSYTNYTLYSFNIELKFILITEHIGYLPDSLLYNFKIIRVKYPNKKKYYQLEKNKHIFIEKKTENNNLGKNLEIYNKTSITNLKEIHILQYDQKQIPIDVFNIVVDEIINKIKNHKNINISEFRNNLYDILIYNIDVFECIYHIITYFILSNEIPESEIQDLLNKTYSFFQYYNNNYRPIYHLENIMFYIINKINK